MTAKKDLRIVAGGLLADIDYLMTEAEKLRAQLRAAEARERCALETADEQHAIAASARAEADRHKERAEQWRQNHAAASGGVDTERIDRLEMAMQRLLVEVPHRTREAVNRILSGDDQ